MATNSSETDRWIQAARQAHDDLAAVVNRLDEQALAAPSACTEWDVAQVLGHLGASAQVGLSTLNAPLNGRDAPPADSIPAIWERWNNLADQAKASGFLDVGERLIALFESLDDDDRANLAIQVWFLPEPVDVATFVSFGVSELLYHGWDVRVAFDPSATLASEPSAAADALELWLDSIAGFIGYFGQADALEGRGAMINVETTGPARSFGLEIKDGVRLGDAASNPDGTLRLPAEAWLRLAVGRLAPEHTPAEVSLESTSLDLDDLRRVFPGI